MNAARIRFVNALGATAWLVVLAALLLLVAAASGHAGAALVLPVAALLVPLGVLAHRPRGRTWWWAAGGSLLWTVEEAYWAAVRVFDAPPAVLLTDALYLAGCLGWWVTLARLPHRNWPRWTLVGLPPLGVLAFLLARDPSQTLSLSFPITDLILLLAALPALEGALRGPASDGRLLWTLGFFVRALAAANYAWLSAAAGSETGFLLLWVLAHLLIGLGVWIELRDEAGGGWLVAAMLVGLESVIFVTTALLFAQDASTGPELATVGALAYVQLIAVLAVVLAEGRRRRRAEHDLRAWEGFVRRLAVPSPHETRPERPLQGLWLEARRLLPGLQGLVTRGGSPELTLGESDGYAYPIVREGTEIARLYFDHQPEGSQLLDTVAPLLGQQIQQLADQAVWRDQATTDPLTGLANRRGLDLALPRLLARGDDPPRALVVAMLDIDHFKRTNDLHGHAVGDRVLVLLARLLRDHTREVDLVVRWGGEEFLVLLVGADEERARATLGRLRKAVRDATPAPLTHPVTLSAGLAGGPMPSDLGTFHHRVAAADAALLRAKRGGRDRVEASTEADAPAPREG